MTHAIGRPKSMAELRERIEDAALTLRRIPPSKGFTDPAGIRIAWPDYVRSNEESYGYDKLTLRRVIPSASEIGRMEEVFGWMTRWWSHDEMRASGLPLDAGIVAWLRTTRVPIKEIIAGRYVRYALTPQGSIHPPGGASAPSVRKIAEDALRLMFLGLGGDPRAEPAAEEEMRIVVDVDFTEHHRVRMIRGEAIVATTHASATHRVVPATRRRGDG